MKRNNGKQEGNTEHIEPSYLSLSESSFMEKVEQSRDTLDSCELCGNECRVERSRGKEGRCRIGKDLAVASINLHFGEEPPISGSRGSGTVFLTGCPLSCVYCQNYPISQLGNGKLMSDKELACKMIELQNKGAHNINFVTPTAQVSGIINAVYYAKQEGLNIPIVYNTGSYDSLKALRLLEGIVDIYLPDLKYSSNAIALKYSGVKNYVSVALRAIKEMYRQVGDLNEDSLPASRGVMIRHLVLCDDLSGTEDAFRRIKELLGTEVYISLMKQFFPAHRASEFGLRAINEDEYEKARAEILEMGFENVYEQIDSDVCWEDFCRKEAI